MLGLVDYSDDEDSSKEEEKKHEDVSAAPAVSEPVAEETSVEPPAKRRKKHSSKKVKVGALAALSFWPDALKDGESKLSSSSSLKDSEKDDLFADSLFGSLPSTSSKRDKDGDAVEDEVVQAVRRRSRERQHASDGSSFAALLPAPKHFAEPIECAPIVDDDVEKMVQQQAVTYSSSKDQKQEPVEDEIVEVSAVDVAAARTKEEAMIEHAPAFIRTIAAPDTRHLVSGRAATNKNQLGLMAAHAYEVEQELALKRYKSGKNKAQSMAKYGWSKNY